MDRIAEISELSRKIKAVKAIAYTMRNYQLKRAALSWLDMASQSLAIEEEDSIEQATANLSAAERIIAGTQKEITMTTKTQPETKTDDPLATIAQMLANQSAMMSALMEKVNTPPAPAAKSAPKSDSALPDPVKPTAKSLSVYVTMQRATKSTIVAKSSDADLHGLIWNDRGLSFGRPELEQLGNPGRVKITVEPA